MNKESETSDITSVQIFLDRKKNRSYVGRLNSESQDGKFYFYFKYNPQYLNRKYAIPLGPELPLISKLFQSAKLFPSFQDRIPPRENPAYTDYCKESGISEEEQNPMVLLSTLGKYGPSSFVFEPDFEKQFPANDLKKYRETLNLTIREFAALFSFSPSHLQRIESKKFPGKDILRLIEIYQKYPEIALNQIKKNSKVLHISKYEGITNILQNQMKSRNVSDGYSGWSANTLTQTEVEYTLNLINKFKDPSWQNFLNSKNIKDSISNVKGYELLVKKMSEKPKIEELTKEHIPTIIKTNKGDIWVYGRDNLGKCQLNQLNEIKCKIEFLNQPYKLPISMRSRPEIYFILNGKYHTHFHNNAVINIKSFFFEIRFAYSIFSSRLESEYEFRTGINEKSVDFKIHGKKTKKNFLVELTSLRDSEAVKEKMQKNGSFFWLNSFSFSLCNENSLEVKEMFRVQGAILEKSKKFPEISQGNYHLIIIDMRGFQTGICDEKDYHHIVYGGEQLQGVYKRYCINADGKRELVKGIFEPSYHAQEIQKKIHAIGFILEKKYVKNEIKTKIKLFSNPFLLKRNDEIEILSHLFDSW